MKLTRSVRYRLDFESAWTQASVVLVGVFLFLRAVWYFGMQDITLCSVPVLALELIVPWVLGLGYVILMRGFRLQMPVVYGGIGAACCLLLIAWGFLSGGGVWAILGLIWYLLAAVVLLGTVLGYVPDPIFLLVAFFLPAVVRFLARDLSGYILKADLIAFIPEASVLCLLCALGCMAPALKKEI